jgi:hypothetical protein
MSEITSAFQFKIESMGGNATVTCDGFEAVPGEPVTCTVVATATGQTVMMKAVPSYNEDGSLRLIFDCSGPCPSPETTTPGIATQSASPQSASTQEIEFDPFLNGQTGGGLVLKPSVQGECGYRSTPNPSISDPFGRYAWRCFAGNKVLDPCFARPASRVSVEGRSLLCVKVPWGRSATPLVSSVPLPPKGHSVSASGETPWGFELATGSRCVASSGTAPVVDGETLSYYCKGGTASYASAPSTSVTPWISRVSVGSQGPLSTVDVTKVWT